MLSYYLNEFGIVAYTMSGDNYHNTEPEHRGRFVNDFSFWILQFLP